jgi:hypothetical protein
MIMGGLRSLKILLILSNSTRAAALVGAPICGSIDLDRGPLAGRCSYARAGIATPGVCRCRGDQKATDKASVMPLHGATGPVPSVSVEPRRSVT